MNKELLKNFIESKKTSDTVKSFLRLSFERKRERDVNLLAAQALALQLLEEAWTEMERHKGDNNKKEDVDKNIGL